MLTLRRFVYIGIVTLLVSCRGGEPTQTTYRAPYQPGGEAHNAERFMWFVPNQFQIAADHPVSAFSLDVDTTGYAVARRYIRSATLPPFSAVKASEFLNYFEYGYEAPDASTRPFKATATIVPTPWNPDTQLLHIGIKAYEVPTLARPPIRVVLAIDASTRMAAPDRLKLIQAGVENAFATLDDRDQAAIVDFGDTPTVVLPATAGSDRSRIAGAVVKLVPHGRTSGSAGLDLAYKTAEGMFDRHASNFVVLITGGEFDDLAGDNSGGDALRQRIKAERDNGIGLRVLGVGSQSLDADLLQELATAAHSKLAYADTPDEAARFFATELGRRRVVVAQDVLAGIEFNPARVVEYRLIGYENSAAAGSGSTSPGADIGSGQEMTVLYEIIPPDSPARHVETLRYPKPATSQQDPRYADEIAYLRIRYRLPRSSRRQTIEQSIAHRDERSAVVSASPKTRFAIAVAAYAEKLGNDGYVGDEFTFKNVASLIPDAIWPDPFEQRGEFSDLLARAAILSCVASRKLSADCE